ncbi:hypothetical protein [Peterkaempfera bronchialis]|uniref:Uncharacterized protein n=1 Tax=Peterkaempfera bronchialis TaxID=2126346 RepID=A0A345SYS1_9ACTN|nr:hypothetical protein [Peterkaempfera bronchialis]AXI78876.1 hypothetical protein C7M71_017100 [Peterkaempfera bronchialis]
MSRFRALAALAVLGALVLAGAGTAQASNATDARRTSNGSVVSSTGSGNLVGRVHGNASGSQQTATGSAGSNQNNTSAATGRSGKVAAVQGNGNLAAHLHYPRLR